MRVPASIASLVVMGLAAQREAGAADLEIIAPAEWGSRHLESRWVTYRADIERHAADKDRKAKWVRWLGERADFEMLEWMAVYEGWDEAGAELCRRESSRWIRAALWNLASSDTHDTGAARKALQADAGRVLAWARRYPISRRGDDVEGFFLALERVAKPTDAGDSLPPLDDAAILLSYFDVPRDLAELGPGDQVEVGRRYLHQVVRALRGARTRAAFIAPHVGKIAALLQHPHAAVRAEAAAALSRLPGDLIPYERLLRIANEGDDSALRRLATLALSYATHPAAIFAMHDIAADPGHPGAEAARQRLCEIGDAFTTAWMARNGSVWPDVATAIEARAGDESTRQARWQIAFERAAWAAATEHAATKLAVQALLEEVPVSAVDGLRIEIDQTRWHAGEARAAILQSMVRLRDDLARRSRGKR